MKYSTLSSDTIFLQICYAAHVDFRAHPDVRLLLAHGGHPAHVGHELPATAPAPVYS